MTSLSLCVSGSWTVPGVLGKLFNKVNTITLELD